MTVSELKALAPSTSVEGGVHGQVDHLAAKQTQGGKPYYEIGLADSAARVTLRAWSDSQPFEACRSLEVGSFVVARGMFEMGTAFGLDAKRWEIQLLGPDSIEELLSGNPELRERQANDFMEITRAIEGIRDPRLSRLCALFIEEFGDRFKRAGAARSNHHARRGGLVEHVAGMLRAGLAIASVHSELNADLIVAGVLFHDCGKLWENGYPADGFQMPYTEYGEMLGHITIGIELINRLWKRIGAERPEWCGMIPAGDDVRLHLLHLIASHHGELQFGSPVVPKTPEAWVLHYVDNLDAKLEMMRQVYKTGKFLAPTIQERAWPLPGNAVLPLPKCAGAATLLAEEQVSAAE